MPLDVKTENLVRVYESRKRRHIVGPSTVSRVVAVDSLDLEIPQGELFGLLGPNGAGKTTTVKILSTLLTPTLWTSVGQGIRRCQGCAKGSENREHGSRGRENAILPTDGPREPQLLRRTL